MKLRKCLYCNNKFIANSIAKECTIECRLMNRIKNVKGCWEWQGKITNSGYGEIRVNQKHMLTHRLSYQTFVREIPSGMIVCHKCDNKKCCNPDHLWLGTQKQNCKDKIKKNRNCVAYSVKHNKEKVKQILDFREEGMTYKQISQSANVPLITACWICNNEYRYKLMKGDDVSH